jgi:hypothetical protein
MQKTRLRSRWLFPWHFWELESKETAAVTAHQGNHTVVLFPTALFAYIF